MTSAHSLLAIHIHKNKDAVFELCILLLQTNTSSVNTELMSSILIMFMLYILGSLTFSEPYGPRKGAVLPGLISMSYVHCLAEL